MPLGSGGTLPPPTGLKPVRILLGRGTQNYTCNGTDGAPSPYGAVAVLFDVSCLADISWFHNLSSLAYSQPEILATVGASFPLAGLSIGRHFFAPNSSTPVFEIHDRGPIHRFIGSKAASVPAYPWSLNPFVNDMYGTVDWLELVGHPDSDFEV